MAHKILIVDDHAATREGLARLLADAGYEVLTSGDVPSAQQLLTDSPPDLLITDVRLDGYNGLHLIAMAPTPIPAIVVTGFADRSIEADARRLGAAYLVKPVEPAALRALIAEMLERAQPPPVFMGTRRAPRERLATPLSVRVGQQLGRVVEVSATGVRLEVHTAGETELSPARELHLVASCVSVPVRVVWTQRQDPHTWVCGAAIPEGDQARWRTFVQTLR